MPPVNIKFQKLKNSVNAPVKQTSGAGAFDIKACLDEAVTLEPGQRTAIPTGIAVEIPHGYILSVRPRSGLAIHHGITMINSPGTIDSDFRGEVKILLVNLGNEAYTVENGERVGQLILEKSIEANWEECEQLNETSRGEKGFGSTGKH